LEFRNSKGKYRNQNFKKEKERNRIIEIEIKIALEAQAQRRDRKRTTEIEIALKESRVRFCEERQRKLTPLAPILAYHKRSRNFVRFEIGIFERSKRKDLYGIRLGSRARAKTKERRLLRNLTRKRE